MTKVITYGTYDLLHYGHIRLLERAKALGDYLIVGVTADDFDKTRGKINVQQSLMERVEAVRATGIADEIIIEEYEGQKIDDIRKYDIDIFTVGSDWVGKFDYLNEYCKVVYLERTEGVSSSDLRTTQRSIRLGLVGDSLFVNKVEAESKYVNGINSCIRCKCPELTTDTNRNLNKESETIYADFLKEVDAIYIRTQPHNHFSLIRQAVLAEKHILCEAPMFLSVNEWQELHSLAKENDVVLMDGIKTAYATAYGRLLLLLKAGKIGRIVSVDSTCTSLLNENISDMSAREKELDNIYEWGPTALLPIFQILGTDYREKNVIAHFADQEKQHDSFVKMDFVYPHAVASIKIGNGVKSEGELIVSGTSGYAYVPAPWWKTDYFEIRYENSSDNKRYFYQLDGEGIRYELVSFVKAIETRKNWATISDDVSKEICKIAGDFTNRVGLKCI